jgi:23S rRNA C2498 (ribose-2'-O)-methylase RlmM
VLSRAYWKLHEAFLLDASLRALVVRPGAKAIDIGASPGGWTAFLASKGLRVLAVDPGAVHASSPLVQHVAKRMEDALTDGDVARFAAATAAATPAGEDHSQAGISLVVCDMNVRPSLSAELIRQLCESVPCPLSPDAVLVLTCKETLAGRSKMLVEEAQAELSDWWMEFRTTHLLSNGKERTLIARRRQDATEEQRKQVRQQVENDKLRKQQRREEHKAAKEAAAAAEAAGNAAAP